MILRKGQAAMEFLMTYGWAILVVLIAIGALAYFGILSPSSFFPEKCTLESGMACTDLVIGKDGVQVQLTNGFGNDITVTEVRVSSTELGVNCYNTNDLLVENGEAADFTIPACNLSAIDSGKNKYDLEVKYTKQGSTFVHTMDGEVLAEVENEEFFVSGSALKFDNTDEIVLILYDSSLDLTDAATVDMWIKVTTQNQSWEDFMNWNGGITPDRLETGGTGEKGLWSAGLYLRYLWELDEWFHYTYVTTHTPNSTTVYINGVYNGSISETQLPMDIGDIKIGSAQSLESFNGIIDEVRVYSRALSAEEISDLHNKGAGNYGGPEPGLVLGLHLDGDASDYSGNGNNGILGGSPSWVTGVVDKP